MGKGYHKLSLIALIFEKSKIGCDLGNFPQVLVVKTTDVRESNDIAVAFRLNWPRIGTVLCQTQVGSCIVKIDDIIGQRLPQMILTQHNV